MGCAKLSNNLIFNIISKTGKFGSVKKLYNSVKSSANL